MIINNCEQGTVEWFSARTGIPTASRFDNILTTKEVKSKSIRKYLYKLAGERMVDQKEDTFCSVAMQRGIDLEPEAREYFEMMTDLKVEQVGLIYRDELKDRACSPDGLINREMGLEIKCPNLETHVEYLLKDVLPTKYFQQVHGSMYVTGMKNWYFMSYYPGMPALIKKIDRNNNYCNMLDKALNDFCLELDLITNELRGM